MNNKKYTTMKKEIMNWMNEENEMASKWSEKFTNGEVLMAAAGLLSLFLMMEGVAWLGRILEVN